MMRIADRLDITGADAFLIVHQAPSAWVLAAENIGNERVHAAVVKRTVGSFSGMSEAPLICLWSLETKKSMNFGVIRWR